MNELPETRRTLLLRLGQQSDDAWTEFLTVYEQAIVKYCRRKGLQDADALDVTQEVLAAVHKRIETWNFDEHRGTFRGWLFGVARNTVVDCMTARHRRQDGTGDTRTLDLLNELPDLSTEADDFWLEYRRTLFRFVAEQVRSEVRKPTWLAFWGTTVEGKKAGRVAEELGVSVGTVYTSKCRVVARVRSKLSELDDSEGALEFD